MHDFITKYIAKHGPKEDILVSIEHKNDPWQWAQIQFENDPRLPKA